MQISVVIPVFNRAHTINRALDSVFAQNSPADEVIVIDDGSTDQVDIQLGQQYPDIQLHRQPNKGVSAARNTGIHLAGHNWIALLDSDDEWLPHKLAAIREKQRQHPDEILFHSDEIWIRNGRRVNPMNKHRKYGGMIFQHCLPMCAISPSAAVIHRSIFDDIGMFDENLPACEDYDLWLRVCHRLPVCYIDQPLIRKYGGHDDQLSRKYWGMDRFRIRSLHALMQQPDLQSAHRCQVLAMLQTKLRILLKGATKHANQPVLDEFAPLLEHYEKLAC